VKTALERQIEREGRMFETAQAALSRKTHKARTHGRETSTAYGRTLVNKHLAALSDAIKTFCSMRAEGRPLQTRGDLEALPADTVAAITLDAVVNVLLHPEAENRKTTRLAIEIGTRLDFERQVASNGARKTFANLVEQLDLLGVLGEQRERRIQAHIETTKAKAPCSKPDLATTKRRLQNGTQCLRLLVDNLPQFVELRSIRHGRGKVDQFEAVMPTEQTCAWIERFQAQQVRFAPGFTATVIPPQPWTTPFSGGYHSGSLYFEPLSLVKTDSAEHRAMLAQADMPEVYQAVNAVQATAWRINGRVLDVMNEARARGLTIGKLVGGRKAPKTSTKKEQTRWQSLKWTAEKMLALAEADREEPALYFPIQLDFRGRLYCVPEVLNWQGSDLCRGVLTFAEGKPLGLIGLRWLRIHGANVFGHDKLNLDDRIKWVLGHEPLFRQIAATPLDNVELWASSPKKAWQRLAFCFEYVTALDCPKGPEAYASSLPVSIDGTCNGLQHFAALMRDTDSAVNVNVSSGETREDIYQIAADTVVQMLHGESQGDLRRTAKKWLRTGVNRQTVKQVVMTVPYSVTDYGAAEQVQDYLEEKGHTEVFEREEVWYFAQMVLRAVDQIVPAAQKVRDWLRAITRARTSAGQTVRWTAPSGFPVLLAAFKNRSVPVEIYLSGKRYARRLNEQTDRLDLRAQQNSVAPNFIHSLDAAALCLAVEFAIRHGTTAFAMVHDSFGTHAADLDNLVNSTRNGFWHTHAGREDREQSQPEEHWDGYLSPLESFLEANPNNAVSKLPERGDFPLTIVHFSDYFFS
jgi:DNA-directed RNA polymerase, mitochondrial